MTGTGTKRNKLAFEQSTPAFSTQKTPNELGEDTEPLAEFNFVLQKTNFTLSSPVDKQTTYGLKFHGEYILLQVSTIKKQNIAGFKTGSAIAQTSVADPDPSITKEK
jgi:hypothetical protein